LARTATFARRIAQVGVIVGTGVREAVAILVGVRVGAGVKVGLGRGVLVEVVVGTGVEVRVGICRVGVGLAGPEPITAWHDALDNTITRQTRTRDFRNVLGSLV